MIGLCPLASRRLAYRLRPPTTSATSRCGLWPLAALLVFYQPFGTFPAHAFQGLLLPLVVLALLGVARALGERPLPAGPRSLSRRC